MNQLKKGQDDDMNLNLKQPFFYCNQEIQNDYEANLKIVKHGNQS